MTHEKATFGAGCFWGVEERFRLAEGVLRTTAGYSGGITEHPTYEEVCAHRTGHAEVVEVIFDPQETSYDALLELFWNIHDPTTLNRQGPDIGTQYRSVIFTHSPEQRQQALASKKAAQARCNRPIVTQILPAPTFWPAEEYHQQYLMKQVYGSCRA